MLLTHSTVQIYLAPINVVKIGEGQCVHSVQLCFSRTIRLWMYKTFESSRTCVKTDLGLEFSCTLTQCALIKASCNDSIIATTTPLERIHTSMRERSD